MRSRRPIKANGGGCGSPKVYAGEWGVKRTRHNKMIMICFECA